LDGTARRVEPGLLRSKSGCGRASETKKCLHFFVNKRKSEALLAGIIKRLVRGNRERSDRPPITIIKKLVKVPRLCYTKRITFIVFMNRRSQPKTDTKKPNATAHSLGIFLIFLTLIILFLKLAKEVAEKEHMLFDAAFLHWIHSHHNSSLDTIFLFFTTIGNPSFVIPIVFLIAGYLLYKKYYAQMLLLLFGVGGASAINLILKILFQRDRPALWHTLITETDYSFPSGHAMASSALILCLIIMVWNTKWRLPVLISGVIVIGMIGVSRLYLGVHYPSDVLAGWSISAAWVMAVTWALKRIRQV